MGGRERGEWSSQSHPSDLLFLVYVHLVRGPNLLTGLRALHKSNKNKKLHKMEMCDKYP